jgi:hypothetical protein
LAHLLRGLPADCAAEIAAVAGSTVYSARSRFPINNLGDLAAKYPAGVHRQVVGDEELASIRRFIRDNMLKGGDSLRNLLTNEALYGRYVDSYAHSLTALAQRHQQHARDTADLGPEQPAMETLIRKFGEHEQQLAFAAFARSAAVGSAASAALAGGHRQAALAAVHR